MENYTLIQKMANVFRRYGYFILLGIMSITIILTLLIVSLSANNNDEPVPTSTTISAFMPVLNASIYKGYFGEELTYNETLKQWETHDGIDFQVASGSKVYSILDGKIVDIYTNSLEGTVIVIEHEDTLLSSYGSLDKSVLVKVGDTVSRGDEIGIVSASASCEEEAGAHLHFAMYDNDKKVDPASYLNIEAK